MEGVFSLMLPVSLFTRILEQIKELNLVLIHRWPGISEPCPRPVLKPCHIYSKL